MTATPEEPHQQTSSAEQAVLDAAADVVDDVTESELAPEDAASMDRLDAPRRMLLVHAHPDDESIGNGATMAHYAAAGVSVTLVTCTRGEEGEVIPPELAHLASEREDRLGEHRVHELGTAMEALGVEDHRFLGDSTTTYRDSGMVVGPDGRAATPPELRPDCFARADLDDAARHLVRVLREVRPQVLVTYEPGGGYGHPDHVHAHRVAMRAVELAEDPAYDDGEPWTVAKVYWTVLPRSQVRDALSEASRSGENPFTGMAFTGGDVGDGGDSGDGGGALPSMVVPDEQVTTMVDAQGFLDAKLAALRAHATQVEIQGRWMALSNGVGYPVPGQEFYRLARGVLAPDSSRDDGRESDLFAGVG